MKNEILKIAEKQLMGGGYGKLNFAKIATELHTTRANLHYHFKNKESLAIAVTREYGRRNFHELNSLREAFKGNFVGFFTAIDNAFWDHDDHADNTDQTRFCTMLTTEPDLPASLVTLSHEFYHTIEQILIDVIQDAIDKKEIRADVDAEREAMRAHVILMGIMTCGQHFVNTGQPAEHLRGLLVDWANSLT